MNYVVIPSGSDPDVVCAINKWYVKVGDKVKVGDALVSYEEDKSVVDICSDYDGVITEIYVQDEDVTAPGAKICAIE